jgi:8-oxo-dGTP pyrophosphatase MutT (NUDIX family)
VKLDYEALRRALAARAVADPAPPARFRRAGVCLLLFDRLRSDEGGLETTMLAIQKTDTEGYHWRNQIALPGGHVSALDRSDVETALRELHEELSIESSDVTILGHLGHFQTSTSRTDLGVTVGQWNVRTTPQGDSREIARVLEIAVADLLDAHVAGGFRGRPFREIDEALVYSPGGHRIWGVTARILHSFLELLLDKVLPRSGPPA